MSAYEMYELKDIKNVKLKAMMQSAKLDVMCLFCVVDPLSLYAVNFRQIVSDKQCIDRSLVAYNDLFTSNIEVCLSNSVDPSDAVMAVIEEYAAGSNGHRCEYVMLKDNLYRKSNITLMKSGESFEEACIRLDLERPGAS